MQHHHCIYAVVSQPSKGKNPEDETQYADSALSAYDPYNTKMYKGVRLHDIVVSNAEVQYSSTTLLRDGSIFELGFRTLRWPHCAMMER